MDPRLLKYYNRELQFMREMGGEFAKAYPKIASRLSLDEFECADPYVERLLEGFSFLAARIQLKIDEEFPRFTQHLMERVFPHYLCPTPSMMVVQFQADMLEPSLGDGFLLPRHSTLRSRLGKGIHTACIYRTAQDVTLWPIEIQSVDYLPTPAAIKLAAIGRQEHAKAAIRIRLNTTGEIPFNKLDLHRLPLFLTGGETGMRAFEAIAGHTLRIVGRDPESENHASTSHPRPARIMGFEENEALLPYGPRSFQGYRYLAEYYTLPERFMFLELLDLKPVVSACEGNALDLYILLDESDPGLEGSLSEVNFLLYCAPCINLFPKRADRIHLTDSEAEYHVLPDRTRPMDYEVYEVTEIKGFGSNSEQSQTFYPFYASNDFITGDQPRAYYAIQRMPRLLSSKQQREGARSGYIGNEVFVSIVDADEAPFKSDLRQLSVATLCTNRDLSMHIPLGQGESSFTLESSTPVNSIRCIGAPSKPKPSTTKGAISWRLINHLSLNYLSLSGEDRERSTAALKDFLQLYADTSDPTMRKQVDGVVSIASKPVNRRLPSPGPIAFGRGLEVTLTLDEAAFEGSGAFLFGAMMEQFFRKYTAINSFTETVVVTLQRGEIMRWPVRLGLRQTL
ncbi:MAG: type VI secretion system baseplate subunit TssF [Candidatus Thiodiazotropha sp.]|nr:type VI secretion system baseplate subunit TssF [Candidatus Thiodiazotropha taylori]MBT3062228.1 type VI secretion system baseplate subunit TssF [Candidatus Thiodiazotropha sp. (ex Lucina pensylvanica)]MBV2096140.1 type VI secretion system baseplate subunit TssF [Candidatus Thiodiazotropha sp. (ex Codakia orbicularis)]PUB78267.1 MAG: type VI secretion system baseplate subunit TssF [gamma proteobacterium symbiont of Ctena orbiculata]PUB80402.1 MAG: type VI secretion system baseplate subunit T